MAQGKNKRNRANILFIAVSLVAAYFLFCIISQQSIISSNKKEIKELTTQVEAKEKTLDTLNDEALGLGSDEYIERIAREKIGLVRPDETVYIDSTGN